MRHLKTFEKFIFGDSIEGMVQKYISDCSFDIQNELGNCAFFAKDFYLWAFKNDVDCRLVYFPQESNQSDQIEDHIVPMVDGKLIDFVWTEDGVSKRIRQMDPTSIESQTNPKITPIEEFRIVYGKFGYNDYYFVTFNQAFLGKDPLCQTVERPSRKR